MQAVRHLVFKVAYAGYNTSLGRRYWLRKLNDWRDYAANHGITAHTEVEPMQFGKVQIVAIPVSFDNYSYLIKYENTAVLVDVGDPDVVLEELEKLGVSHIDAILVTHKHWDHQHGATDIASKFKGCVIYGGNRDFSSSSIRSVEGGSEIKIGNCFYFQALFTPGHTAGHTCYLLQSHKAADDDGKPIELGCDDMLFSGDHLFLYGCGRVFETPYPVMLESFEKLLNMIKDETLIFPGHEYTLINLQFTLFVLPDDPNILQCFESALRFDLLFTFGFIFILSFILGYV